MKIDVINRGPSEKGRSAEGSMYIICISQEDPVQGTQQYARQV